MSSFWGIESFCVVCCTLLDIKFRDGTEAAWMNRDLLGRMQARIRWSKELAMVVQLCQETGQMSYDTTQTCHFNRLRGFDASHKWELLAEHLDYSYLEASLGCQTMKMDSQIRYMYWRTDQYLLNSISRGLQARLGKRAESIRLLHPKTLEEMILNHAITSWYLGAALHI